MIQVQADPARNVLHITFSQTVNQPQAERCRNDIRAALGKLQPGFRLLTDLSGLESMDVTCASEIAATMDMCRRKGVGEVIRVIPDPTKDIGFKLMSLFHYDHGIPIVTCATLSEALERLA